MRLKWAYSSDDWTKVKKYEANWYNAPVQQLVNTVKSVETPQEMEGAKALRIKVFVDEQGVPPEEEIDELDATAFHAIALGDGVVVGTGRLLLDTPTQARIGRMAVTLELRRSGIGGVVLEFLEEEARAKGIRHISLDAQAYVTSFYAGHGYKEMGEPFLEVGIPHIQMVKDL